MELWAPRSVEAALPVPPRMGVGGTGSART